MDLLLLFQIYIIPFVEFIPSCQKKKSTYTTIILLKPFLSNQVYTAGSILDTNLLSSDIVFLASDTITVMDLLNHRYISLISKSLLYKLQVLV